jgi:predicted Zn-dependent protease
MAVLAAAAAALAQDTTEGPPADQGPKLSEQDQKEVELGREGLKQVESELKLVTDEAVLERVRRIGGALAQVATSSKVPALYGYDRLSEFQYEFRVIDDPDINAFALPGGFVFVYTGLLGFVESDDELAGVLAHEIAHAAHHHMVRLATDMEKANQESILGALVVGVLSGGGSENVVNLLSGLQLYQYARSNAYVQEAETDADTTAYHYLKATHFDPVGMLTFMERLHAKQMFEPAIDWGIFRTHPPTAERATNILRLLKADNLPIRRSKVSTSSCVQVREVVEGDAKFHELYLGSITIARLAPDGSAEDPLGRAKACAEALNRALDAGVSTYELRAKDDGRLTGAGTTLLAFTEADAAATGQSVGALAKSAYKALRHTITTLDRGRSLAAGVGT